MAIRVALNHQTRYRYPYDVWLSPHVLRLRPAPHCRTPILSYSLSVTPKEHFINWQQDPYSNRLARLVFPKKTRELAFEVDLVAELTVLNPFDFFLEKYAEGYPFQYGDELARELQPYLEAAPAGPKLAELVQAVRREDVPTVDFLVAINHQLRQRIHYLIRMEPGIQTPEESLTLCSGSCRDSAWLLVQLLRRLGLAARFVSGYLIQLAPDVKSLDGPSGAEKDFTDLHAWAEVYIPGAGWIGLDATSGLMAGEGHLPLACTADPTTAAAVTGAFNRDCRQIVESDPPSVVEPRTGAGNGKIDFHFSMTVTRLPEEPRVTRPYTEQQWARIDALGQQVDADLRRGDVRLTMGGEPTFVSIDDPDGPEWNSDALGPAKYRQADELIRRLRDRFAVGGFLHHGQGKWYPGEPLPRWALGLFWRKDGEPIWKDPKLVADEKRENQATENDARSFAIRVAERLGVESRFVTPGYEDVWYYLWKERRLPVNVDPLDSKLDRPEERARLAKVFEQGLDKVVGYALPLRREHFSDGTGAWRSGPWFLRTERMYLVPGDSPMGFRLPLESIPWMVQTPYSMDLPQDPWTRRGPLPAREAISRQHYIAGAPEPRVAWDRTDQLLEPEASERSAAPLSAAPPGAAAPGGRAPLPPAPSEPAPWVVRTALCAEVRGAVLRIFLPPQRYLEDFLELIGAVEDTARDLNLPILVEGYEPPHDHRLHQIKVTPDPGVIEVNTRPAESWDELVTITTTLYEEARLTRLGAEKFMLDGRHTGTGGGNHIVLGGPTPADSPLLRRPDLLRSLIGYWHNHPALSYLFSGQFVGPTSQAPRIDEARNDQVYELEVAFRQTPVNEQIPPWLVDRIYRHLLVDATGNTHRAEFCIDKLFAPETSTGRLGLLEMRAFEMPPHARMSLTQHLLLRALVSRFWQQPYTRPLVRWRTEIHDRYMLPHFVKQDLDDVVRELNEFGYPFDAEWFASHMEFRFPRYGAIHARDLVLELRQAIEPWHVLGEEPGSSGTVRYVDSSMERLQARVDGMVDSRHVITCNRIPVPLHPTGANGQFVAGVRYRAWQPPSCLHPTIRVDTPLVFDVVDTWAGRSIGGCRYHVSHPGGRNYNRFPINAYEAEGRRLARFYPYGHTPGPMHVAEEKRTREFPFTLDMRWHASP